MSHEVESVAWVKTVPWHGLGFKVSGDLTPAQMLKAAHLDWTVSKRPMFIGDWKQDGEKKTAVQGAKPMLSKMSYSLVRDSDNSELSTVGQGYNPVQNKEALDFFKKFVEAGKMTMETAGSLYYGRYVWALAKIGQNFTLAGGDKIEGYLLLCSPHVHGKSLIAKFTPIRVVCWNTLSAAIGADWGKHGGGAAGTFRMPHSMKFDDTTKEAAEQALGIAKGQMEAFEEVATKLSKKKLKADEAEAYFFEVLRLDPKEVMNENGKGKGRKMVDKFQAALTHAPGQELSTAKGTVWGALNAVTYVVDHQMGLTRDIGLKNAWLGYTDAMKTRALNLAIQKAK